MSDDTFQIPAEILQHARTAFMPVTKEEQGALTATKFGGRPWLAEGEEWPVCPNCEQPMQLFAQLNLDELPEGVPTAYGSGLVQFFYCMSSDPLCEVDCEAFFPFADSVVARHIPDATGPANDAAHGPQDIFPERVVTGWEPVEDYPNWEELTWNLGVEIDEDEFDFDAYYDTDNARPRGGDKLGGWPDWVQSVEYPDCPECGERMELLLQVDSEDNVPHMFGDLGCGHLTRCPNHAHVLAFGWACG